MKVTITHKVRSIKKRGQGMTEYLIIVALVAIAGIAIVKTLGQNVRVSLGKVAAAIQGVSYSGADAETVTKDKTEGRGLHDFNVKAAGK